MTSGGFPYCGQSGQGSGGGSITSITKPTAYWSGNLQTTVIDGAVSQADDLASGTYPATQSTAGNRPILSGGDNRENRVLYSEQFDNAYWSKTRASITPNAVANPVDGAITADLVLDDATATTSHLVNITHTFIANTYAFSIYAKKKDYDYIWLGGYNGTTHYRGWFNLATGAKGTEVNGTGSIESIGSGWYRCTFTATVAAGAGNIWFGLAEADNSINIAAGTGAKGNYTFGFQYRLSTSSTDYIPTTTYPIYPSINSNRVFVFDGTNDSLTTTLAVNPTGGMSGACVVKPTVLAASRVLSAFKADATARFSFAIAADGSINAYIMNGNTVYIGRTAPASTLAANETAVLSFTYDGSTSSGGIKFYKNSVQIDTADSNAGSFSVPTAGETLRIGAGGDAARYLNGSLSEPIFVQGTYWSDGERGQIEAKLMAQFGI